jgi:hypothetical protein
MVGPYTQRLNTFIGVDYDIRSNELNQYNQ